MTPSIHLTGGLGFIGSNLVRHLNARGITPYVYDRLEGERWRNVVGLSFHLRGKHELLGSGGILDDTLIHLGADVDTTAPFTSDLWANNVTYSLNAVQRFEHGRVVYASSAAVYGAEESDFTERLYGLKPLNAYAFTKFALDQDLFGRAPVAVVKECYGLRLFNVYGPNEEHKGEMASVVHKAISGQLARYGDCNTVKHWNLFKSHRAGVADGDQQRDFVHVDDVCEVICHFALGEARERGVYNVGTGTARSFKELVTAIDPTLDIEYRDMPANLRDQYQYHTKADLTRLRAAGYTKSFMTLEEGVKRMV